MKKLFAGIDPGADGAIVILNEDSEIVFKCVVPKIGNDYDKRKVIDILYEYPITHAILEDVHAFQLSGATSAFSFGRSKMLWEMALLATDTVHTLVQPKKWQQIWEGVPIQYKPTTKKNKKGEMVYKVDTKATSLLTAQRLFPKVDLRATERARTPHDGIVDAALMALYCLRTYK